MMHENEIKNGIKTKNALTQFVLLFSKIELIMLTPFCSSVESWDVSFEIKKIKTATKLFIYWLRASSLAKNFRSITLPIYGLYGAEWTKNSLLADITWVMSYQVLIKTYAFESYSTIDFFVVVVNKYFS